MTSLHIETLQLPAALSRLLDKRVLLSAALAFVYGNLTELALFRRPLVVVCGGIGVDLVKLVVWKNQFSL